MTDGQRNAAAWLQLEGWSVFITDAGFVAVNTFSAVAIMATERKTIVTATDSLDKTVSLVWRRTATLEVIKAMLAKVNEPEVRHEPS
jgi:hypothetical protein